VFATFTAGRTNADIRVALIDRPEMLDCVLATDAPGFRPDLIVLGEAELTALAGHPVREPWEAVAAIERLRAFGPEAVLASLGAGGAVLVDATGAFHAQAELDPDEGYAHGSLDALLGGFLTAGASGPEALAAALLTSASAPDGNRLPTVHVTWIDALELARACTPL
jgi:1-phosphofructokinase